MITDFFSLFLHIYFYTESFKYGKEHFLTVSGNYLKKRRIKLIFNEIIFVPLI